MSTLSPLTRALYALQKAFTAIITKHIFVLALGFLTKVHRL